MAYGLCFAGHLCSPADNGVGIQFPLLVRLALVRRLPSRRPAMPETGGRRFPVRRQRLVRTAGGRPRETVRCDSAKRVLSVMLHPLGGIRTYILYNYPAAQAGYQFTFVAPAGDHFDSLRRELQALSGAEFVAVPVGEASALEGNYPEAVEDWPLLRWYTRTASRPQP